MKNDFTAQEAEVRRAIKEGRVRSYSRNWEWKHVLDGGPYVTGTVKRLMAKGAVTAFHPHGACLLYVTEQGRLDDEE